MIRSLKFALTNLALLFLTVAWNLLAIGAQAGHAVADADVGSFETHQVAAGRDESGRARKTDGLLGRVLSRSLDEGQAAFDGPLVLALREVPSGAPSADKEQGQVGDDQDRPVKPVEAITPVPRLVGLPATEARQRLRLAELRWAEGVFFLAPKNWRDEIDPAVIGLQAPQAGKRVSAGASVGCWRFAQAAFQQKILKTPNLLGKRWTEARDLIIQAGLRPAEGPAIRDLRDDDIVADQYPRPDQSVYERTSVLVSVSLAEDTQ